MADIFGINHKMKICSHGPVMVSYLIDSHDPVMVSYLIDSHDPVMVLYLIDRNDWLNLTQCTVINRFPVDHLNSMDRTLHRLNFRHPGPNF